MVFLNSSLLWLETIQEVQFEKSLISNILTTTLFTLFCVTGVLVNSSILLHVKKRDDRNVDKIIKLHSMSNNFLLITLFLFCLFNALSILKDYTGYFGCLSFSYHQYFSVCYIQLHSFFMALYRYTCVINSDTLIDFDISGKVNI